MFAATRDAIIAIDGDARITRFDAAAEGMFGYRAEQVLGVDVARLMPPRYRDEHDEPLRRYRRTGEAHAIGRIRSVQGRRATGEMFPIDLSVTAFHVGNEPFYTAIIREVSERQALLDALRSERDFAECPIDTAPVILLGLDDARRIVRCNRSLQSASGHRPESVRPTDAACRYGGEEFAVVLVESGIAQGRRVAERIGATIRAIRFEKAGQEVAVTVSIGLVATKGFPTATPPTVATLVSAADGALYVAKRGGRDRTCEASSKGPVRESG